MKFTGKITHINELNTRVHEGNTYQNREVLIDATQDINGRLFEDHFKINFTREDLLKQIETLQAGDEIEVLANLSGRPFIISTGDRKGQPDVYQELRGSRIDVIKKAPAPAAATPGGVG